MKRRNLIDEYRAAGYPEASLDCLYDLESRTDEHLDRYLSHSRCEWFSWGEGKGADLAARDASIVELIDKERDTRDAPCARCQENQAQREWLYLERYRHLRPIGKLFSPEMLGVIRELTVLEEYIVHLEEMVLSQRGNLPDRVPLAPLWDC